MQTSSMMSNNTYMYMYLSPTIFQSSTLNTTVLLSSPHVTKWCPKVLNSRSLNGDWKLDKSLNDSFSTSDDTSSKCLLKNYKEVRDRDLTIACIKYSATFYGLLHGLIHVQCSYSITFYGLLVLNAYRKIIKRW